MNFFRAARVVWLGILVLLWLTPVFGQSPAKGPRFEISFSREVSAQPLDGRMYLLVSKDGSDEPRFQIGREAAFNSQQIFGVDVDGLRPSAPAIVDNSTMGYPVESLAQIPPGDYFVQGFLNIYETFHLAGGHVVKLPPERGEGQKWFVKPGNLYSAPARMHFDPAADGTKRITLTQKIPPITPGSDSKYVKYVRLQSRLLSQFWGRPTEITAIVLLPEGYDEHPQARFPEMIEQGHFNYGWDWPVPFRTEPPTEDLKGEPRRFAEYGYKFYQDWTSGRLPHMIGLMIQHANPYYDDSYAVNSASIGPYGDAIVQELIPEVEKRFRAIGQPWARYLYGASTGGWESLAMQVFYPDFFNGAFVLCPDPIDFRAFMTADIYKDKNVFWNEGPWLRVPHPAKRTTEDVITATIESWSRYESVLGSHLRSGEQLAIWQAVFGPMGPDGYPKPLWGERTGAIDPEVADYWKEHYDLSYILQRDWTTLGPKLVGKLHFKVGTRDTFYLDGPVRLIQKFLETTNNPYYAGDFEYGPHQPHGYWGDPSLPQFVGRSVAQQKLMPEMVKWIEQTAPPDADRSRSAFCGRYHLHPAGDGVCLLGGDPGRVFPTRDRLGAGPYPGSGADASGFTPGHY
jgi:hypothetical protein